MNKRIRPIVAEGRFTTLVLAGVLVLWALGQPALASAHDDTRRDHLSRAKIFLAAGDYRRALDACLREVEDAPSVQSYVYLTYVYHTIDGYLEHLAKHDRWIRVEHLFLNLSGRGAVDLVDPLDALARMAKEIMHEALQKQSDISAAMATRLDRKTTEQLWQQQAVWRKAHPDNWWGGVPKEWAW